MWSFHRDSNLILLDDGLSSQRKTTEVQQWNSLTFFFFVFTGKRFDLLRASEEKNGEFNRKNKLFEC